MTNLSNVHVIDGSGFIYRAYHALPPLTRKSDGLPTGAILGFCNMLTKYISIDGFGHGCSHLVVALDSKRKTFRDEIYSEYKSTREKAPEELGVQFKHIKDACEAFGVATLGVESFEADDIMATLAYKVKKAGGSLTMCTGDKDMMQLIGKSVRYYDPMKNAEQTKVECFAKFGVKPKWVPFVQTIIGDKTDNIPGVTGIGVVGAAKLAHQFKGDIEKMLANTDQIESKSVRDKVEMSPDRIRISLELVTLRKDVPLGDFNPDAMQFWIPNMDTLGPWLDEMEFGRLKTSAEKRIKELHLDALPNLFT